MMGAVSVTLPGGVLLGKPSSRACSFVVQSLVWTRQAVLSEVRSLGFSILRSLGTNVALLQSLTCLLVV